MDWIPLGLFVTGIVIALYAGYILEDTLADFRRALQNIRR